MILKIGLFITKKIQMLKMDNTAIKHRISELTLEHKDLDDALNLMKEKPFIDELQLRRIKVRKLKLKDEIELLQSKLIPDIEA